MDNEFDQCFEDCDGLNPVVRDPNPIDMVQKHADVVAWAQSAWPSKHCYGNGLMDMHCYGNSLDNSVDQWTEDDVDSELYDKASVAIPKSLNPQLGNFQWRSLIEPR